MAISPVLMNGKIVKTSATNANAATEIEDRLQPNNQSSFGIIRFLMLAQLTGTLQAAQGAAWQKEKYEDDLYPDTFR